MGREKVLVTGGTGVTGVALVRYLLEKGKDVTAIVRQNSKRLRYLPKHQNLHIVPCNLVDYGQIGIQELGGG